MARAEAVWYPAALSPPPSNAVAAVAPSPTADRLAALLALPLREEPETPEEAAIGLLYDSAPYVVVMGTPADLEDLAVGFTVTERVAAYADIERVSVSAADEGLLAFGSEPLPGARATLNLSSSGDLTEAAANLFAQLRALDRPEIACIAVMPIPDAGLGLAINDRLRRAATPGTHGRPQ